MRILAFMKYGAQAASTRQRLVQFLPYLREHDISVEILPLLDDRHVENIASGKGVDTVQTIAAYARRLRQLLTLRDYDLLWVHYELFPYLPGLFERLGGVSGKPIICDYDDATFHMYDNHRRPIVRKLLGNKLEPLLRQASGCICGNQYLETYARQFCPNTIIIPTVVDTAAYVPRPRRADDNSPPVVGWIGSPSTWRYVEPFLPTLLPRLKQHGAILRAVGAGPRAQGIEGVVAVDWSEEREVAEVQAMDIGIMPLPDEPWARGKCGYKLIQYMACGLPVIASPVGVNSEIVSDGINGFLLSDQEDWGVAISELLENPEMRRRMGIAGRSRVETSYSLASQQPRLLDFLRAS